MNSFLRVLDTGLRTYDVLRGRPACATGVVAARRGCEVPSAERHELLDGDLFESVLVRVDPAVDGFAGAFVGLVRVGKGYVLGRTAMGRWQRLNEIDSEKSARPARSSAEGKGDLLCLWGVISLPPYLPHMPKRACPFVIFDAQGCAGYDEGRCRLSLQIRVRPSWPALPQLPAEQ